MNVKNKGGKYAEVNYYGHTKERNVAFASCVYKGFM